MFEQKKRGKELPYPKLVLLRFLKRCGEVLGAEKLPLGGTGEKLKEFCQVRTYTHIPSEELLLDKGRIWEKA